METAPRILREFGRRLRDLRLKRGLSQELLATRSGMHRTYIGMLERAEKNITLVNLERLAKGLGVRVRDLTESL